MNSTFYEFIKYLWPNLPVPFHVGTVHKLASPLYKSANGLPDGPFRIIGNLDFRGIQGLEGVGSAKSCQNILPHRTGKIRRHGCLAGPAFSARNTDNHFTVRF